MNNSDLIEILKKSTNARIENIPAKAWTWLNMGGKPICTFIPSHVNDLKILLATTKGIPYRTFGAGSNLLIRDGNVNCIFIRLMKGFRNIHIENNFIIADAGALSVQIVEIAIEHNLGGIEFIATIPGMLGGLIKMNAGAHGSEMKDIVQWVEFMDEQGNIHRINNEDCKFEYRKSKFQNSWIILKACLKCYKQDKQSIQIKLNELIEYRKKTQPTSGKMAGCIFKNPKEAKAWELIKNANMRSENVCPSPIHANFITNLGNATAFEMEYFIKKLQANILLNQNIWLETEVEIIGNLEEG
jgi:UDP-N-acetylmuramate dehydrogenase